MISLSFLGTGNYQKVKYHYNGKEFETDFFPCAVEHFFAPDNMLIACTKEASEGNGKILKDILTFEEILIPSGKNVDELWEMFSIIEQSITPGSELIIDVTHGFRSQPMIALAIAEYLKNVKSIKIKDIIYGAFEARDSEGNAPVFSLLSFSELMDWAYASRQFRERADFSSIRDLLRNTQSTAFRENRPFKPTSFIPFGNLLNRTFEELAVVNTKRIMYSFAEIPVKIDALSKDIEKLSSAKPFSNILEGIRNDLLPLSNSTDSIHDSKGLLVQSGIIRLYLKQEQYQQAITLSRELLLTHFCHLKGKDPNQLADRNLCGDMINNDVWKCQRLNEKSDAERETIKKILNYTFELQELWNQTRTVRNYVDHAGMTVHADMEEKASNLIKKIKDYCNIIINIIEKC